MRKIVLLVAMLAMTLFAVAPAFGESYVIPLDEDGFVGTFEEGGFESSTILSEESFADVFEGGNAEGAQAGSGFELEDPFVSTFEFEGQSSSAVGAGGFVYVAGDFGVEIIDLSELEEFEEEGGAG